MSNKEVLKGVWKKQNWTLDMMYCETRKLKMWIILSEEDIKKNKETGIVGNNSGIWDLPVNREPWNDEW